MAVAEVIWLSAWPRWRSVPIVWPLQPAIRPQDGLIVGVFPIGAYVFG